MNEKPLTPIEIGLTAAVVAIEASEPRILVASGGNAGEPRAGLPFGPFDPLAHRTLELGLRGWVEEQTGLRLGYIEQLYSFGDRGRHALPGDTGPHMVSVGYLALTRIVDVSQQTRAPGRRERVRLYFGSEDGWDEERVLDRFELLYEAGLVEEARRDGRPAALSRHKLPQLGEAMRFDHRRILATAIARLRAKLKYRPVVFELMPREFTLTELQHTVEAISGQHLHKQNFRRVVETAALVEPTGDTSTTTGGRPAALFRFRREVMQERPAPGLRLGGRSS